MHNVRLMQPETATAKQEMHQQQQQQLHVHVAADDEEKAIKRKPVSRRALRKILSRLQVDAWTSQHDAKFLDLLLRHTGGGGGARNVGELTGEDWSSIRAELNAATGSGFPVEELQRRLGEFRREFEAASRIKNHPRFSYDPRRRVVVAKQADWKNYILVRRHCCILPNRECLLLGELFLPRSFVLAVSGESGGGGVRGEEPAASGPAPSNLLRRRRRRRRRRSQVPRDEGEELPEEAAAEF